MKIRIFRKFKYDSLRLLRIKKSDHLISMGFIAGFFHCWFPTFGIGLLLSIGLARLLRGNVVAAVISGSLGTVMWPGLFFLNYKIGFALLSLFYFSTIQGTHEGVMHHHRFGHMGMNFLVGSIVNSIVFSIMGYFLLRFVLMKYRLPLLKLLRRS
ncbi:DUF2062 domain-containing protein [Paenibacillus macquariensis]|uniref:DUF2062 domain-containing protein n=1 Tax=Paenibacillus macquariensis TaxID=948756 RepID=A0ABY1JNA4_9BACL|nr:DUF2062 domain-containing protein [Paenibacillus macquariensis]MEC0092198.1 DUF2062 domain-containing protein [Paenibacillus macquariensis]OAB37253.1 hypothetical protein PMSM_04030 [Paenibacillus macquariensis subsp. macquariensis]SIQ49129.1 hypothetical protein SAMN05421578_102230 [Paenibacillus macquariensis]